jgi:phosphoesterase RecJ-like protein
MPETIAQPRHAPSRTSMTDLLALLKRPGLKLITGHVRPDGDALGASLALGRCLRQAGHDAIVVAEPSEFGSPGFLEGCKDVMRPSVAAKKKNISLIVSLDCGTVQRLPEPLQPLVARLPVINIDHHRTNTRFGQINWIDATAGSTSEMVWRVIRRAGWKLDHASAEALWVGVVTDTGRFAYDQTSPRTMRCGADLLRHGVRTAWINDLLFGTFNHNVLELKRRAFHSLEVSQDGRVATVTLTHEDFDATHCQKSDAEDIIEIARSLRGSYIALFFYEAGEKNLTRLSIRTREPLDATHLALQYNGGGHARAAGCTIPAAMPAAKRLINKFVTQWLAETSFAKPAKAVS